MTLIKTSFWSGLSVLIKAVSTFITSKLIALYMGPVGLALIEQFQNFIQIIRIFSGNLIQQGIVKYVAEYKNNEALKMKILSTSFLISIVISFIFFIILFYFSSQLSFFIFKSYSYNHIIKILSISIILFSFNSLLLATLNGELEIKKYVSCNIFNTLSMLFITILLIQFYGLYGGLLALVLNQSFVFFFTFCLVLKCNWFKLSYFIKGIDTESLTKLFTYALIMIISTLAIPVSHIIIRNYVGYYLSWQEAGYWQAIMRLSTNYSILIDVTLSIYYLPKLSKIANMIELKKEILNGYAFILPLAILGALFVFTIRNWIVIILYSEQFLPIVDLFKYQLLGDIARMGSWILFYVMIAKTMVKALFITELSFLIYYSCLTIICIHYFGLMGTTIGFAISNFIYWMIMLFFIFKYTKEPAVTNSTAFSIV